MNKFFIFLIAGFSGQVLAENYQLVKGHTDINFTVKHMLISKTRGVFKEFRGEFNLDEKKNELEKLNVEIDAGSVFTNDIDRDTHLKKEDFLYVEKYPTITFTMDKIKYNENKTIKTNGILTIRSIAKKIPITLTFNGFKTSPFDSKKYGGFTLKTRLDRKDYGMTFNKTLDQGGLAIDNNVDIEISGEFIQKT
jgi:polyisoprenoid-binding protein YceI